VAEDVRFVVPDDSPRARVIGRPVPHANSISGVVPIIIAAAAGAEGIDPTLIVSQRELETPPRADEHIDFAYYLGVWRRAIAAIPDPAFALRAASLFKLEDHEVFGFLAMSCETLGQAYDRTATYRALYCIGARWELLVESDATRMVWYPWPGNPRDVEYRAAMDYAVADMANAIRRLSPTGPTPIEVRLAHKAPAQTAAFAEHYGVEPKFGTPLYELVYAPGLVELPVTTFNSRLRDYFDQECKRIVSTLVASTRFVEQVRKDLIAAMDGGDTSIETIAKRHGMSPRSLQRRLTEEGTRYNDLLSDIRAEFAKRYLARGTISASEVAYLLGFTEPPAFFKAFKRWTGLTPREFQLGATQG
jgi:AraC-like DNA-binding protein